MQQITIQTQFRDYPVKSFIFPGGEVHVEIPDLPEDVHDPQVFARIQSSDDLVQLMLVWEVIYSQIGTNTPTLVVPYFPYARQDRKVSHNVAFSLKPIASLIHDMDWGRVTIVDPHSDVTPALLCNVDVIEQVDVISKHNMLQCRLDLDTTILVSPDAGASKKALKTAGKYGRSLITASKVRDVRTGEITGTRIDNPELINSNSDLVIIDDICDGGRTFIELAKVLREYSPRSISLYVTHGIFSKGLGVFDGIIDQIFTTDSFMSERLLSKAFPLYVQGLEFNIYGELI